MPKHEKVQSHKKVVAKRQVYHLVLWWMSQTPHVAVFENETAASAAASVRNGLMMRISGRDLRVDSVHDWYRRDNEGKPIPAEWRDLIGQITVPWMRPA